MDRPRLSPSDVAARTSVVGVKCDSVGFAKPLCRLEPEISAAACCSWAKSFTSNLLPSPAGACPFFAPHIPQNLSAGSLIFPQEAQAVATVWPVVSFTLWGSASLTPHKLQNPFPDLFSLPHARHSIARILLGCEMTIHNIGLQACMNYFALSRHYSSGPEYPLISQRS